MTDPTQLIKINQRAVRDAASLVRMRVKTNELTHNEMQAILEGLLKDYLAPIHGVKIKAADIATIGEKKIGEDEL